MESREFFLVMGLRQEMGTDEEGYGSVSMEILAMFDTLENALIYRDLHAEMDTTTHAVTIVSTTAYSEVPDLEVFLHVIIEDDDTVRVRSRCVDLGAEPWLREGPEVFEALCYPEDRDLILDRAQRHLSRLGRPFEVVDEVPPEVLARI